MYVWVAQLRGGRSYELTFGRRVLLSPFKTQEVKQARLVNSNGLTKHKEFVISNGRRNSLLVSLLFEEAVDILLFEVNCD